MEWVEGESLAQLASKAAAHGGIPLAIAVNLIVNACKGLQAAHELRDESGALLGVVHRDISPQNVLVTYAGTAKLVDFGVAKFKGREGELTREGELKGKFAYMAPEQVSGGAIDRRTDVFAMGALAYLVTTGRRPFQGDSPSQTLRNICYDMPPSPSTIVHGYPIELERAILKALSKRPEDRYATASDLLVALERAVPECHEGSLEPKIAAFMDELFGDRARERRAKLREAQELASRASVESERRLLPASVRSLRAVAVEATLSSSGGTLASASSVREGSPVGLRASVTLRTRRSTRTRWVFATLAALATFALLSIVGRRMPSGPFRRSAATSGIVATPRLPEPVPTPQASAHDTQNPPAAPEPTHDPKPVDSAKGTVPRGKTPPRPMPRTGASAEPAPVERPPAGDNPWDKRF
jgi:serine/threonine-protein kinase